MTTPFPSDLGTNRLKVKFSLFHSTFDFFKATEIKIFNYDSKNYIKEKKVKFSFLPKNSQKERHFQRELYKDQKGTQRERSKQDPTPPPRG